MSVPQVPAAPQGAVSATAPPQRRKVALLGLLALVLSLFVATPASTQQVTPDGCDTIDRHINLYAEVLEETPNPVNAPLGYGLAPGQATRPGPVIEMVEGECLAITLHNNIPAEYLQATDGQTLGVSLHTHGVKYTIESDGTAHSNSVVPPGESRTYIWYAQPREVRGREVISNGTAGYWWYHDHNVGDVHGSRGIPRGLAGALIVRRPGDPKPDKTFTVAFDSLNLINYRSYPATDNCDPVNPQPAHDCFVAKEGELVEFAVFSMGEFVHTFHLHGHNWAKTRTGIPDWDRRDDPVLEDNHIMAAGDSFGFMTRAGHSSGPGSWMLHCHVGSHAAAGMWTFFHVLDENGQMSHLEHKMTPGFEALDDGGAPAAAAAADGPQLVPQSAPSGGRDDSILRSTRG